MRSIFISLAALALCMNSLEAVKTSGLLRESRAQRERGLQSSGKKASGKKAGGKKAGNGSLLSPSCPAPSGGKKASGKKASGGKKASRFLEAMEEDRFLQSKSGGKKAGGKKAGGKKAGGGDDGCDCDPPTDLCPEPTVDLQCGAVITEDTILSTPLACTNTTSEPTVVTVIGATLECTGDMDNMIYHMMGDTSSTTYCVILQDGAELINCYVYGCNVGVAMIGRGNNRVIGSHIVNTETAIETGIGCTNGIISCPDPDMDMGCYSVECTHISSSSGTGIMVRHDGDMIISNSDILYTSGAGISVLPYEEHTLTVAIEDVNIFASLDDNGRYPGVRIGYDGAMTVGTILEVGLYGDTKITLSSHGVQEFGTNTMAMDPTDVVVYGNLDSFDASEANYEIMTGTLILGEDSTVTACTSDVSFDLGGSFMNMGEDNLVCFAGELPGSLCPAGMCPGAVTEAAACESEDGTSSKGKGGSKGGKGSSKGSKGGRA